MAGEAIPLNVLRFIAAQLGMRADSGLSVRFCPLPESTPYSRPRSDVLLAMDFTSVPSPIAPCDRVRQFHRPGGLSFACRCTVSSLF